MSLLTPTEYTSIVFPDFRFTGPHSGLIIGLSERKIRRTGHPYLGLTVKPDDAPDLWTFAAYFQRDLKVGDRITFDIEWHSYRIIENNSVVRLPVFKRLRKELL